MRVSNIVQITVVLNPPAIETPNPPPRRFVVLFTRVPNRAQLVHAFEHKAETFLVMARAQGKMNVDLEPLRTFIEALPRGEVRSNIYRQGMVAVDTAEPLYSP